MVRDTFAHSPRRIHFTVPKLQMSVDCRVKKKYVEKFPCFLSHFTDLTIILGDRYLTTVAYGGMECAVLGWQSFDGT